MFRVLGFVKTVRLCLCGALRVQVLRRLSKMCSGRSKLVAIFRVLGGPAGPAAYLEDHGT